MALKYWIGGVLGAGVLTVAGANLYADQQLKNFYLNNQNISKQYQINVEKMNIGPMSGQVDYTLNLILDPCHPEDKISLQVKDHIKRSLMGYHIQSEIQLPKAWQPKVKELFADKPPISAQSTISWFGGVDIHLSSPAIDYKKDEAYVQSKGLSLDLKGSTKDAHLSKEIKLKLPSLIVRNEKIYLALDQLTVNVDNFHAKKLLPHSTNTLRVNQLHFSTFANAPINIKLEQLKMESRGKIKDQQYDLINQIHISKFNLPNSEKIGALTFNLDIKNLNLAKLEEFIAKSNKMAEQCMDNEQRRQLGSQAMLDLLEHGINIESNKNSLQLGSTSLIANFKASLSKAQYADIDSFIRNVPSHLQYQGDVETSKAFVQELLKSKSMTAEMNNDMINRTLEQLRAQNMLRIEGDKISSRFEYKAGKASFNN